MNYTTWFLKNKKGLPTGVKLIVSGGVKYHLYYKNSKNENNLLRISGPDNITIEDCDSGSEILISTCEKGNDWVLSVWEGLKLLKDDRTGQYKLKVTAKAGEEARFSLSRNP